MLDLVSLGKNIDLIHGSILGNIQVYKMFLTHGVYSYYCSCFHFQTCFKMYLGTSLVVQWLSGPVAKILHSQFSWPRFDHWSGN